MRQQRRDISRDRPVLSVRNLSRAPVFQDVSFDLYPGEVLGMAGLMGAGRTDVLRALFGADPCDGGEIVLDGTSGRAPYAGEHEAARHGLHAGEPQGGRAGARTLEPRQSLPRQPEADRHARLHQSRARAALCRAADRPPAHPRP